MSQSTPATSNVPSWLPTPQQLVLLLLIIVGVIGFVQKLQPQQSLQVVPVTARAIPAYTVLSALDLSIKQVALSEGAVITDAAQIIGSISISALTKGETLQANQLLQPNRPMSDTMVLTVPLSNTIVPEPGQTLFLLGIDTKTNFSSTITCNALVLGNYGNNAVVLVTRSEAEKAAIYLGGDRLLFVAVPLLPTKNCP